MGRYNGEFWINHHAYLELFHFCMRYHEFKDSICNIMNSGGGANMTYSESAGRYSDPTANKAINAEPFEECIKIIEQTAIEAGGDNGVYQAILYNVTQGWSYEQLRASGKIPMDKSGKPAVGSKKFHELRRKFFYLLYLRKSKQKLF